MDTAQSGKPQESSNSQLARLIVKNIVPELYEAEVYLWEIVSVLRRVFPHKPTDDADFVRQIILAATEIIVELPGVETYFTGWPLEGDWQPCRSTMATTDIVETIRTQLDQLGREPTALEIAFFRGVETG